MQRLRFETLGLPEHRAHVRATRLGQSQVSVRHTHDFFELFLVLEGEGTHHLNDGKFELKPGALVAIEPRDVHHYSTRKGAHLVFINVAVSAAWWRSFHTLFGLARLRASQRGVVLEPGEARMMEAAFANAGASGDPSELVRAIQMARRHLNSQRAGGPEAVPSWLEALRRDLASNPQSLAEPIGFWQRRSGKSPEHLARSCRRYYGVTLSELINQARVERARYLLRTTKDKVITVAFECGFGNMANFHRVFARMTGCTPNDWRQAESEVVPVS